MLDQVAASRCRTCAKEESAPAPATPTAEAAAPAPAAPAAQEPHRLKKNQPWQHLQLPTADSAPAYPATTAIENHLRFTIRASFCARVGCEFGQRRRHSGENRITHEDVRAYIKVVDERRKWFAQRRMAQSGVRIAWAAVWISCRGHKSTSPNSAKSTYSHCHASRKFQAKSVAQLGHDSHVTNNEVADVTELEAFRVQLNKEHEKSRHQIHHARIYDQSLRASFLKKFPEFNASGRR